MRKQGDQLLGIDSQGAEGLWRIVLAGELDLSNVKFLEEELRRAEASDCEQIIVELGSLEFIDSTGLSVFVQAVMRSRADGNRLFLRAPTGQVKRIFEVSGVDGQLPLAD